MLMLPGLKHLLRSPCQKMSTDMPTEPCDSTHTYTNGLHATHHASHWSASQQRDQCSIKCMLIQQSPQLLPQYSGYLLSGSVNLEKLHQVKCQPGKMPSGKVSSWKNAISMSCLNSQSTLHCWYHPTIRPSGNA